MAYQINNNVQESSTTSGTGAFTLNGAVRGYQSFLAGIGSGNTTQYLAIDGSNTTWELGIGVVGLGTLTRQSVISTSAGTTALINFSGEYLSIYSGIPTALSKYINVSGASLVSNSTSSATSNTVLLQSMLSAGGVVNIITPGNYYINSTITLPTKTILYLGEGVTISSTGGGTAFTLFTNAAVTNSVFNGITLSGTVISGQRLCLITAVFPSAPGLNPGDYFLLDSGYTSQASSSISGTTLTLGATNANVSIGQMVTGSGVLANTYITAGSGTSWTVSQSQTVASTNLYFSQNNQFYSGAWEVYAVSGNNVQFLISSENGFTPPNSAGIYRAVKCDYGVGVIGPGRVNGNYYDGGFTAASNTNDHAIVLSKVAYPVVGGLEENQMTIRQASKYAVCLSWCYFPKVKGIFGDQTEKDGIHVYGPSWYPEVSDISGTYGDDCTIFQTIDGTGYAAYMPQDAGGSFYRGGKMANILPMMNSNSGSAVFYPAGGQTADLGYRMFGNYIVENVSHSYPGALAGTFSATNVLVVGNGYVPTTGGIDSIHAKNVQGNIGINNVSGAVITIGKLTIDDLASDRSVGDNVGYFFDYVNIEQLIINNLDCVNNTNNNTALTLNSSGVVIGDIILNQPKFTALQGASQGASLYSLKSNGATVRSIKYNDSKWIGGSQFFGGSPTFANSPVITFNGVDALECTNYVVNYGGSANLTFMLRDLVGSSAFFNFYGSGHQDTLSVYYDSVNTQGNQLFFNGCANAQIVQGNNYNPIQRATPTTGATITLKNLWGNQIWVISPAATIAALTLALPTNPIDGEKIELHFTKAVTTITPSGGTLAAGATIPATAGQYLLLTYDATSSLWT